MLGSQRNSIWRLCRDVFETDSDSDLRWQMRKSVFDLLWGLIAFIAVLAVSILTREHQDIRSFALATFFGFFAAAFHRAKARTEKLWLTALLVGLGGIVPVVIMNQLRIAFTGTPFFLSFLMLGVSAAALGTGTHWLRARGRTKYASLLGLLSSITVLVTVFAVIPRWIESSAYRVVNREVTPFAVESLNGEKISSEAWKGHVVVLSFWATWCTPCQAELPEIATVRAHPEVLILALNSGNHGETPSKAQAYLAQRKLMLSPFIDSFGVAPDEDSWGPAAKSLSVQSLPALYILDRQGRLRVIHQGFDPSEHLADSLSRRINQLL